MSHTHPTLPSRHLFPGSVTNAGVAPGWTPETPTAPTFDPRFDNARIEGLCPDRFAPVWEALQQNLVLGDDIGASVAVFIDGEPVVDIWGGYFDASFDRAWDRNTIITTHSITKTMTALAALTLADKGELDFDKPVAFYWPAFAANGKQGVLVRHLLGHTSGLPGWTQDVSWDDVYDLDYASALLAAQAPWWQPGTVSAYHGMTQGHLVSGVIKGITGLTLGRYFAEHLAGPLGADYHIGTGPEHDHRIACLIQGAPEVIPHGNPIAERVGLNPNLTPQTSHTLAWRRAEIGAANGHGNARSVAKLHSALVADDLLSEAGRRRVLEPVISNIDRLLGVPITWGPGFTLECELLLPNTYGHRRAFWGGNGGHFSLIDFDLRMVVSFVMNRWLEGPNELDRYKRILAAAYRSLNA